MKQEELVTAPTTNLVRRNTGYEQQQQQEKDISYRGNQAGNYRSFRNNHGFLKRRLNQMNANNSSRKPTCQLCGKFRHGAKTCRQYKITPVANFAQMKL